MVPFVHSLRSTHPLYFLPLSLHNSSPPFSTFYANVFDLFQEGYPIHAQMGLAGTWFTLDRAQSQALNTCACPIWGQTVGCCNQAQSWCAGLAWSIEGGGGYWRSTFPKNHATWRMVASSACYHSYANTLDWNPTEEGCSLMNVVQLSNRLLLPPDGVSFSSQEGLVGYGWLDTPLGKTSAGDGRNFWTLVFDTETFSGPVVYILPEFYAQREPGSNVPYMPDPANGATGLQMGENAAEVQLVPAFKGAAGQAWRLPRMRMPMSGGRAVLSMGQRAYKRSDVGDKVEAALGAGVLNTSDLMSAGLSNKPACAGGGAPPCVQDAMFTVNAGEQRAYKMGVFNTSMVGEDVVWALQVDGCDEATEACWLPQYLTDAMEPLPEASAPADLKAARFPEKTTANPPHPAFDASSQSQASRYVYAEVFESVVNRR